MSYLLDTLASLVDGMSQDSKDDSVIVVFIAEVNKLTCNTLCCVVYHGEFISCICDFILFNNIYLLNGRKILSYLYNVNKQLPKESLKKFRLEQESSL